MKKNYFVKYLVRFLQQYDKNPAPPIPENLEEGLLAFKGYSVTIASIFYVVQTTSPEV